MRPPPPLRLTCRDLPAWRACRAALTGVSMAVAAAWLSAWMGWSPGWTWWVPALCVGVSAAIWAGRADVQAQGTLAWTGQTWTWQAPDSAQARPLLNVEIAIDLQSLVLVRLQSHASHRPGVPGWICLQRADAPDDWSLSCLTLRSWRLPTAATDVGSAA